ncbi:MAG: AMP-binding protein [Lachnospiraceae bacterium]|nr:AMP-binding protein [Lachnospiraceae bacterium]
MKAKYVKDLTHYEYLDGWERSSLGQQLEVWVKRYRGSIAVADSTEEISYEELGARANRMAHAFWRYGIRKGDRVLVQLPNRCSFVTVFFALAKIGAVPVLALPAHRMKELEGIAQLAQPAAYIVPQRYLGFDYTGMAEEIRRKFPCIRQIFVDGQQGGNLLLSELATEEAERARTCGSQEAEHSEVGGDQAELPTVDGYQTAVLLLSGGTTGVPKLIPRTHADYMYNGRIAARKCRLDEQTVYLAALPVAHNFPLCCPGLLGTLDAGGKVVLAETTSPDDILAAITRERVTITALVPAMVSVCMELLEWEEEYDLSSLRILQVGGAMLEDTLADRIIRQLPCKLMQVFGTAEGLLSFTGLEDDDAIVARCQGKPLSPADEIKLVDEEGREVRDGEYGELLSRGPYTIDGYYRADEANEECFTKDGFYRTGDRAMRTAQGNLRMGGRVKEQINRAGEKIMPAEIEGYLCGHANIREAAVIGIPDEEMGNRSCAFLLTENGDKMSVRSVHGYLKELGVASYKLPDQVECVEAWPLTSVGKIDKKALLHMVANTERG